MPVLPETPADHALDRLRAVSAAAGLDPVGEPRRVISHSNDAWLLDDRRLGAVALRVGWRGDITRLDREMAVLRHVPPMVRTPVPLGSGHTSAGDLPLTWTLTRRIQGEQLDHAWPFLDGGERRAAIAQLAEMLWALHRWRPPGDVAARLRERPGLGHGGAEGLVGADVTALPPARALALVPHVLAVAEVDPGLLDAAAAAIADLAHLDPHTDDPARGLVHGDLHLSNVLRSGDGAITLLDLEWARLADPVLEIQRLCDRADDDVLAGREDHPAILRWLAADYAELFAVDQLVPRLRLQSLAYGVRDLIVAPAVRAETAARLRRMVDGRWPAPGALPV